VALGQLGLGSETCQFGLVVFSQFNLGVPVDSVRWPWADLVKGFMPIWFEDWGPWVDWQRVWGP
jgi:hypothetical protein